ncbi:MAG: hypothetical protein AB9915_00490 [Candidatus Dojkabacteria bacterium]
MNKKILAVGILALGVIASFGISKVYAYRGDANVVGPYHTEERQIEMEKVMAEKDYEGWKEIMTEGDRQPGVLNKVDSQEEFNQFANAYELSKEGKTEEAKAIREELGLGNGEKKGQRHQNKESNFVDADGNGACDNRE